MISQMPTEPVRRQRRKVLTDRMVADLKRKAKRYIIPDPQQAGLFLRIPPKGPVVYAAVARHKGKQVWCTIGGNDVLEIETAREQAREAVRRIKKGELAIPPPPPPEPVKPDSVADVADQWLARHVQKKGLITGGEIERQLKVYILPLIGSRRLLRSSARHRQATRRVEDNVVPWIADSVLGILRGNVNVVCQPQRQLSSFRSFAAMRRVPVQGPQALPHPDRRRATQSLDHGRRIDQGRA